MPQSLSGPTAPAHTWSLSVPGTSDIPEALVSLITTVFFSPDTPRRQQWRRLFLEEAGIFLYPIELPPTSLNPWLIGPWIIGWVLTGRN